MNIWHKRQLNDVERQRNEIKKSDDWKIVTKGKKQNKPSSFGVDPYPTLESSQYSELPVNRNHFLSEYKTVAYNIATDIFKNMHITNYEDYLRMMVDFLVTDRDKHINQLRLKYSHSKNRGFLQIPEDKYIEERKYLKEWANDLIQEMQRASRRAGEDASTEVEKMASSRRAGEDASTEVEKMAYEDNLTELGFSIPFIQAFYSDFPEMQNQVYPIVARSIFEYEEKHANQYSQASLNALPSGFHNAMQYAAAYAAPVAYAGPHGITYAAMAYDPVHAMTNAAPVQYGDAHALTRAAPGWSFDWMHSVDQTEGMHPESKEFEVLAKAYVNNNDEANHFILTQHRGIEKSIKNMLFLCIQTLYKKLSAEQKKNIPIDFFRWFEHITEPQMKAIEEALISEGYNEPYSPAFRPTINCIKQMQRDNFATGQAYAAPGPKFEQEQYVVLKPGVTVENPQSVYDVIDDKVPLLVEDSDFDAHENKFYYLLSLKCANLKSTAYPAWHYCTDSAFKLDTLNHWQSEDKLMLYAINEEDAKKKYANAVPHAAHTIPSSAPGPFNRLKPPEINKRNAARNKKKNEYDIAGKIDCESVNETLIDDWDAISKKTKKDIKMLFGPSTQYQVTNVEDLKYLLGKNIQTGLDETKISDYRKKAIRKAWSVAHVICKPNAERDGVTRAALKASLEARLRLLG